MVVLQELPEHYRVYSELVAYFKSFKSVIGIFLSGSSATDSMDKFSDIDIGIVVNSDDNRDSIWKNRWKWALPKWFHRFDADHVRDHFIIYFFYPDVKADIVLYTMDTLPPPEGGPYLLTYVDNSKISDWNVSNNLNVKSTEIPSSLDVEEIIHDDERIWAWLFYCYLHIARGEYYTLAADFFMLRGIVEKWIAHFRYRSPFGTRRLESKFSLEDLDLLKNLFPIPEKTSLMNACDSLIDIMSELRTEISSQLGDIWRTSETSIKKVKSAFRDLTNSVD